MCLSHKELQKMSMLHPYQIASVTTIYKTTGFPSRWGTVCRLPNHVPSPPPSSGCRGRAHQQMCPLPVHHPDTQKSHHAILTFFSKHGITRNRNFRWLPARPYFSSRHNCHDQVQHSKNQRQLRSNPDDRSSRVVPWLPLPNIEAWKSVRRKSLKPPALNSS